MLDVHPPHETAHSWKDFSIHIATIVVGLVIAVGLEQAVEVVHHRHQAHQLNEDMRAEAEANIRIIDSQAPSFVQQDTWAASVIRAAQTAPGKDGSVSFTVPSMPPLPPLPATYSAGSTGTVPSRGVWTVATAQGLVNLLPHEQAQIYNRLDFEASEAIRVEGDGDISLTELNAMERALGVSMNPGEQVHITLAQRDEFVRSASKYLELAVWYSVRLAFWKGASEAVVHNVSTMNAMFPYINGAADKINDPPVK